jgi:hypothetical protein
MMLRSICKSPTGASGAALRGVDDALPPHAATTIVVTLAKSAERTLLATRMKPPDRRVGYTVIQGNVAAVSHPYNALSIVTLIS